MGHSISSVAERGHALTLIWNEGTETSLPYLWLRDNCGCAECRVEQTTEKRFHIFRIDQTLQPHQVTVERAGSADEAIVIAWPDGHHTRYRSSEIYSLIGLPYRNLRYWDYRFRPRAFDYQEFLRSDWTAAEMIDDFLATGASVLINAPTEPNSTECLAPRLGPIREVVFERIHNVRIDPKGYSIAHTNLALAPHNDMVSYSWPPSVQALHMLVNECEGGDSSIVDGFAVLDQLRRHHPDKFDVLCAVPVPFRLFSEADESYSVNPMVELDGDGNVKLLRFNTQQMQPVPLSHPRLGAFYAAYHELSTRMNADSARASFRLDGGQILLTAAHRVLHGRTALRTAGRRHLQDAYFEHDNVRNHLYVLRRSGRLKPSTPDPAAA